MSKEDIITIGIIYSGRINSFKNLKTSLSSVFRQYCQKSNELSMSSLIHTAPDCVLPIFLPSAVVNKFEVKYSMGY